MGRNDSYDRKIEDLSDAEVLFAIRYLDPDNQVSSASDNRTRSELAVSIVSALLAFIGLICFYLWSH